MSSLTAPLLATGSLSQERGTPRAQLAAAAKQFEAIFVRQMLAAARKTDFGGDVLGGQGLDTFRTIQDEQFADLAADTGAFGLAKMIERQLAAQLSPSRLRKGSGEGLFSSPAQQALPHPLPQAGGGLKAPLPSAGKG